MTKRFWWIAGISGGACLLTFCIISIVLACAGMVPLGVDSAIANWAYGVRGDFGGATYWFFRVVTELGYTYVIAALVILMFILWRAKPKAWFFGGTILVAWAMQKLLKVIFMRPRPDEAMWWMAESSTSFPSGHSMMAACVFILLAYFIFTSPEVKNWLKYTVLGISTFAIIIVPISRIILGVHYFTDVLGGVFVGAFFAIVGIIVYHIFMEWQEKKKFNLSVKTDENSASESSPN